VISGEAVVSRRRGKSKAPNFTYEGPVSVIRLELDIGDARVRQRLERQWACGVSFAAGGAARRCGAVPGVPGGSS
jgi:hypothetical protein